MTIETIKDVLGRILVINKNLTEDSLKTLLDASGWDADDIREGLRIFRDYQANGNDMSKVDISRPVAPIATPEPVKQVVEVKVEEPIVREEKVVSNPLSGALSILDLTRKEDPKPVEKVVVQPVVNSAPTVSIPSILEAERPVPPVHSAVQLPPVYNMAEDVHHLEEYVVHEKPWLLIVVNVILFIITLALLVYILMH